MMYLRVVSPPLVIFLLSCSFASYAIETIQITKGNLQPIQISVSEFQTNVTAHGIVDTKIEDIISNDLASSGFFQIHHNKYSIGSYNNKISAILSGTCDINPNISKCTVILQEANSGKQIFAETIQMHTIVNYSPSYREIAHKISDKVYESMLGYKGYFNSKIVYSTRQSNTKNSPYKIAIVDSDGANTKYLASSKEPIMSPKLSPQSDRLLYACYNKGISQICVMDLTKDTIHKISYEKEIAFAPSFSPNGNEVVFCIAGKSGTNIFKVDLRTKIRTQLTHGISGNISPVYSRDGERIYYSSDKSGTHDIYVMDTNGQNKRKLTFGDAHYLTPSCSPDDKYIAFTKISREKTEIGRMNTDGTNEKILVKGTLLDSPTWSPNGCSVLYTQQIVDKHLSPRNVLSQTNKWGKFMGHINTVYIPQESDWNYSPK